MNLPCSTPPAPIRWIFSDPTDTAHDYELEINPVSGRMTVFDISACATENNPVFERDIRIPADTVMMIMKCHLNPTPQERLEIDTVLFKEFFTQIRP